MSAARDKGTRAETAVVRYLQAQGWPYVERRASSGCNDKGDIAFPGIVIEVKSCERMALAAWLDEAEVEAANAKVDTAVVWHRRKGVASPADWYVTMSGRTFVREVLID